MTTTDRGARPLDEAGFQLGLDRLARKVHLLQALVAVLLLLLAGQFYLMTQLGKDVEATVKSVDEIHLGLKEIFVQGLPELRDAQQLARGIRQDLGSATQMAARMDQSARTAVDGAFERARQELPPVMEKAAQDAGDKAFERAHREMPAIMEKAAQDAGDKALERLRRELPALIDEILRRKAQELGVPIAGPAQSGQRRTP